MIIKNAIKNLGRTKGRWILISFVVALVMLASTCSLVVYTSAKQLAGKQMQEVGAQVIITRNDNKLTGNGDLSDYREISVKQMKSFTNSSFIKSSAIYASAVGKTALDPVAGSGLGNGIERDGGNESSSNPLLMELPNILLIASTNEKINDDFINGLRKIKEGRIYKKAGEVLISEELAKKNNLKAGDTFEVKMIDLKQDDQVPVLKLQIAGIFEDHKPLSDGDAGSLNKSNEVLMDYETFLTLKEANLDTGVFSVEGSFWLKDPNDVKKLENEFHKKGMPEYFELSVNQNAYQKSVAPIVQVSYMALLFSIVTLIAGALIMIAISLLSIRERKYEIGVLRAMGMKKRNICLMICIEMCTICFSCAFLALMAAQIGAQPIADMMLNGIKTTSSIQFGAFYIGSGGSAGVTSIVADLSPWAIVMVLIVSGVLGLLGSASGVWYITKNEPMRILAERN